MSPEENLSFLVLKFTFLLGSTFNDVDNGLPFLLRHSKRAEVLWNFTQENMYLCIFDMSFNTLSLFIMILLSLLKEHQYLNQSQYIKPAPKLLAQPQSPSWILAASPSGVSASPCSAAAKDGLFSRSKVASRSQ